MNAPSLPPVLDCDWRTLSDDGDAYYALTPYGVVRIELTAPAGQLRAWSATWTPLGTPPLQIASASSPIAVALAVGNFFCWLREQ
jgi:hypothetical protein